MSVAVAAMVMTVSATVVRSFRVAQAKGRMDIGPRTVLCLSSAHGPLQSTEQLKNRGR